MPRERETIFSIFSPKPPKHDLWTLTSSPPSMRRSSDQALSSLSICLRRPRATDHASAPARPLHTAARPGVPFRLLLLVPPPPHIRPPILLRLLWTRIKSASVLCSVSSCQTPSRSLLLPLSISMNRLSLPSPHITHRPT